MVLFLFERETTGAVLVFILWRAIGGTFHAPAMLAATSLMVPVEQLARVQGFNQMLQGGLGILTAPLGALLLGLVGMAGAMAVDVLTAFCAIVPLLFVPVPEPAREAPGVASGRTSFMQEIAAGFRYLRSLPGPMAIIGFASVVNLFLVPAFALLPLLVLQELGGDASHQAWLGSAFGVGAIAGGLALGTLASARSRIRTALGSLVGLGLATILLGLSPAGFFPAAVAAILAVGALSAMANGSFAVLLQATIAPEYQGRVFTLMMSVAGAMTPIGLLLAAPFAELAGVRAWYIAGGLVCAAIGTAAFFVRSIVRMEDGGTPSPGRQPSPDLPSV
jgi:DHA3 family macrolide efflux protein-like MFS transporter